MLGYVRRPHRLEDPSLWHGDGILVGSPKHLQSVIFRINLSLNHVHPDLYRGIGIALELNLITCEKIIKGCRHNQEMQI